MLSVIENRLIERIDKIEQVLDNMQVEAFECKDDSKSLYKIRTISAGMHKSLTELYRSLTSIQLAKANLSNEKPSKNNDNVVFKGTREDLLKELRMNKQIEQESINDELINDEPEHAFNESEDIAEPILKPTKKEDMKMKRALYGVC